MKQNIGIALVIILYVEILLINIVDLVFVAYLSDEYRLLWMSFSTLLSTTTGFVFLAILIYLNKDQLGEFQLDRFSLLLLALFGFIFRVRPITPGQQIFIIIIFVSCLVILAITIREWNNIQSTVGKISVKTIFIAICVIFLLIVIESLQPNLYNRVESYNPVMDLIKRTYRNLTSIVIIEEMIFRGFLWGHLIQFGWSKKKVIWAQAIIFWLVHFNRIFFSPITFFISIPITIIVLTYLVIKTKQVFWPIIFHTASNVIVPVVLTTYYLNVSTG